jgi:hypothetical protein
MTTRTLIARNAALGFLVHGALVVAVLSLEQTSRGGSLWGWDALRIFRGVVEFPVLWAIDGVLESFVILPIEWFRGDFDLAYHVNVALTYVLIGGAFYAPLAATVTALVRRWRERAARGR